MSGSGNIKTEIRNTETFTSVQSSGAIDIEIRNGTSEQVEVQADDNLLSHIVTSVKNGLLDVHYKSQLVLVHTHVKVFVTMPTVSKIYVSGSGDIISRDTLKSDNDAISLEVEGSGSVKALVHARKISADLGGSGSIELYGLTKELNAQVSGSGDIKCHGLLSEDTKISVEGSGSAHVFASVSLTASVSGSGDIFYSGNPPSPKLEKEGSGSIHSEN